MDKPLSKPTYSQQFNLFMTSCLSMIIASNAFAAGGLDKANTLLQKVVEWLNYLSIAVVTIAILVVGYKVLFGGQTIRECSPIIIGAVIIASASTIASLLMG